MNALRWLASRPNAALRTIAEHLVIRWLRDAGAGKHGALALRVYDAARGMKTLTGLLLGLSGYLLMTFGKDSAADYVTMTVGAALVGLGLADKAVNHPGRPEILANSRIYQLLADNMGAIAAAFTAASGYVFSAQCVAREVFGHAISCTLQGQILLGLGATAAYLGLLDVALLSKTPAQTAGK